MTEPFCEKASLKTLIYRTLTLEQEQKLTKACDQVIDFMRKTLQLDEWECYYVSKIVYACFPIEYLDTVDKENIARQ